MTFWSRVWRNGAQKAKVHNLEKTKRARTNASNSEGYSKETLQKVKEIVESAVNYVPQKIEANVEQINELLGITESYKAPDALMKILFDREKREGLFRGMLELFRYEMDIDWFHAYFQDEHADRKQKKQDFTPASISNLLANIMDAPTDGMYYEPCAGTGGLTIAAWHKHRIQHSPFEYKPSMYYYTVEELSDRALPFLLFNLLIRGMNATVVQCDVLTREAKAAFFIQNDKDDHMLFSSLNVLPYSKEVEDYLSVKFTDEVIYGPHIESTAWPVALGGDGHTPIDFSEVLYEQV